LQQLEQEAGYGVSSLEGLLSDVVEGMPLSVEFSQGVGLRRTFQQDLEPDLGEMLSKASSDDHEA
jgi:hypothetical protein